MCRIRLLGKVTLEVFPSTDCDDLSQIELVDLDEYTELEVEIIDVNHGVLFAFPDGRSSSLPVDALALVESCDCCDEDWHLATLKDDVLCPVSAPEIDAPCLPDSSDLSDEMRYEVVELGSGRSMATGRQEIVSGGGKHDDLRGACAEIEARRLAHGGGGWTVIDVETGDEVEEFEYVEYDDIWACLINQLGMNEWEATHLVDDYAGFPWGGYLEVSNTGDEWIAVDPRNSRPDVIARDADLECLRERLIGLGFRSEVVDAKIEPFAE